ncbi:MAG: S24/S26 family peptidase [Clostridia bacterium]|nr:S24/S26 family peptidase [Clostridia bacterium]
MSEYKRVIEKYGVLSFTPSGSSMWPIISNRADTVIIKTPPKVLKKYDVAFYERASGQAVLHRVIKVHENTYDMCGDSHTAVEKGVPFDAVFGIMAGYYKGKKYIDCEKNLLYKVIVRFWSFSIFFRRCMIKGLSLFGIRAK